MERIDEHVVGPLLDKLRSFDTWRILVAPDHPTPVSKKTHTAASPPFCMAGTGIEGIVSVEQFNERFGGESDLHIEKGHELMEYFLRP